ncbi:hypothetical protein [Candidatus Albibeggiatoa sp. nov. NOAA]|uniref:hypothetical protein n=1 Tax=Candidatus Albibeggiatoa sp. nov. NOAA TaxID=3162724 RepID=UPI0032F741E9|nr:hypothetical protein [Thiotrichaceae bacterium]
MRANAKKLTVETGIKFAEALVEERYVDAHLYLTKSAQQEYTPEKLLTKYQNMVDYGSDPVVDGYFHFMANWPARLPQDIGWVYISISGSYFAEAVTVIVSDEDGFPKIREIEWGRP